MKTTANKKTRLPGISMKDDIIRLKKKRPDIYKSMNNPDPYISFGWNVITHRHRLGLTQMELAQKAGVSCRTIQSIENVNEVYNPTLGVINGIAKALGVSAVDLIKNVDLTTSF